MSEHDPVQILRQLFDSAVAACHPSRVVPKALPQRPSGRIVVLGAGKAAAAMAAAVEDAWGPPLEGLVVTRYGHSASTKYVEVIEAGHPYPDAAGNAAALRALQLANALGPNDLALVLLSGGGSSLWSAPLAPIALEEKQALTRALVLSGASISEINCVRKHVSVIKGGRLAAAAHPARVLTLAISDVPHDDISVLASGPTVADPTTQNDTKRILQRYGITTPWSIASVLNNPANESIKPGDARLANSKAHIIARGKDAIAVAADEARRLGFEVLVIGTDVEGVAIDIARKHAALVHELNSPSIPLLLISGGELTVTVQGKGCGGPSRQYLLSLARALEGKPNVWALAADTDGIDGSDDTAGAWLTPHTLANAVELGLDARASEQENDAGTFFAAIGQSLVTGPTRTNVNDFRAILVMPGD